MRPGFAALERTKYDHHFNHLYTYQQEILSAFDLALDQTLKGFQTYPTIIEQPKETLADAYFTKNDYLLFPDGGERGDFGHMGQKYGEIALANILDIILK